MLIERLQAWLINRLPSRRLAPRLSLTEQGLLVETADARQEVRWTQIDEIVAVRADQFVGDSLLLLIRFDGDQTLSIPEQSEIWAQLTEQIPLHLDAALQHQDWALRLIGDAQARPVTVYRKASPLG
jgi:hypothetical protein